MAGEADSSLQAQYLQEGQALATCRGVRATRLQMMQNSLLQTLEGTRNAVTNDTMKAFAETEVRRSRLRCLMDSSYCCAIGCNLQPAAVQVQHNKAESCSSDC